MNNNKGTFNLMDLPVNLLVLFITVTFLIALIPGFVTMVNMGQDSQGLNCVGYVDSLATSSSNLSYNATIGTKSTIGCLAMQLYIPYIVLGVLVAVVSMVFYGRGAQQQSSF